MSRPLADLELVLEGLLTEHRKLLTQVLAHEAAVRTFDLKAMDMQARLQHATRQRISGWDLRRKAAIVQLAKTARLKPDVTLTQLAVLFPQQRDALLKPRDEIKALAKQIAARSRITGRIATAVLGQLNTAVRLLAGAVEKAGLYTKQGMPRISNRIGVMEAVG